MAVEHLQDIKALPPSVSTGVVSADLLNLGEEIKKIKAPAARMLHFDIREVCRGNPPSRVLGPEPCRRRLL